MDQQATFIDSPGEPNLLLIDIATRDVMRLASVSSLAEAAAMMQQRCISSIVVTDEGGHPVGIVTERNILQAMRDGRPGESELNGIMSAPVITVGVSTTKLDAYQLCLNRGIRHLVIVDNDGVLMGVVSETDFRLHLNLTTLAGRRKISFVAKGSTIALPPSASLKQALDLMLEQRKSCVVAVEEERPVGIVTERDVVKFYSSAQSYDDVRLGDAMVAPVRTIPNSATTMRAAEEMLARKLRHLVVVDEDGRMTGLVSEHDLTRMMAEGVAEERSGIDESFLRTLINTIPDLVWLKDVNGVYLACNARVERMFGAREREVVGKTDYDFVGRDLADAFRENDRKAVAVDGLIVNEEWITFSDDGHRELVETIKTPMRNRKGELLGVLGIARNITDRKLAEIALTESEHRYRVLVEYSPFCIHEIDLEGRLQSMNHAGLDMLGLSSEAQIRGVSYMTAVSDRDQERIAALLQKAFEGKSSHFEFVGAGDSPCHFKSCFIPIRDGDGNVIRLMGLTEDITEAKRADENLRINASVFDTSQEAILITDANNLIIDVNPAFTRITGYTRDEVRGKNPGLLSSGRHDREFYAAMWRVLAQEDSWRGEIWNRRKNGELYAELLSISVIRGNDGEVLRYVAVFSDISRIKAHEAELSRVAHYDALTGIPNRVLLADRMKQAIAQTAREGTMMAVCYIDLDGFKPINDNLGHGAGDHVLVEIARRIEKMIRGGDTVARLGGDEFVILLLGLKRAEECVATLKRLLRETALPIEVDDKMATVGASIGVTIFPQDSEDADTLLRHADQAMYLAKQAGKHCYHIYDPSLDRRARDHNELKNAIRYALEQNQFELYYQPKIDLKTRRLVGVEALIRWHHPERGLLHPSEFLRAVEGTDLDIKIGEWVIETALAQLAKWWQTGFGVEVSVNVSAHHLEAADFVEMLGNRLARHAELPAGCLQIEVLETAALEDVAIVNGIINACRELGVGFALDDFGTGYSSLTYLSRLPVDALKIDQFFVRDMLEDKGDMAIVQGIIALAEAFELQIVAEGIETPKHYQALVELGCEIGQGYGIARPMSASELECWRTE